MISTASVRRRRSEAKAEAGDNESTTSINRVPRLTNQDQNIPGKWQVARLKKSDIISLKKDKGLKQSQIAKLSGYSEGRISQILQEHKTNPDYIAFKDQKADILEGLQANIINSIEPEDIKKASLQQKIISTSVLQDKIEQIRGDRPSLSDNQINVLINNVVNNYVVKDTQSPEIIDVQGIPEEIVNNLNEL